MTHTHTPHTVCGQIMYFAREQKVEKEDTMEKVDDRESLKRSRQHGNNNTTKNKVKKKKEKQL